MIVETDVVWFENLDLEVLGKNCEKNGPGNRQTVPALDRAATVIGDTVRNSDYTSVASND
jgi:hypothetical protein